MVSKKVRLLLSTSLALHEEKLREQEVSTLVARYGSVAEFHESPDLEWASERIIYHRVVSALRDKELKLFAYCLFVKKRLLKPPEVKLHLSRKRRQEVQLYRLVKPQEVEGPVRVLEFIDIETICKKKLLGLPLKDFEAEYLRENPEARAEAKSYRLFKKDTTRRKLLFLLKSGPLWGEEILKLNLTTEGGLRSYLYRFIEDGTLVSTHFGIRAQYSLSEKSKAVLKVLELEGIEK